MAATVDSGLHPLASSAHLAGRADYATRRGHGDALRLPDAAEIHCQVPMVQYEPERDGRTFAILGAGGAGAAGAAAAALANDGTTTATNAAAISFVIVFDIVTPLNEFCSALCPALVATSVIVNSSLSNASTVVLIFFSFLRTRRLLSFLSSMLSDLLAIREMNTPTNALVLPYALTGKHL